MTTTRRSSAVTLATAADPALASPAVRRARTAANPAPAAAEPAPAKRRTAAPAPVAAEPVALEHKAAMAAVTRAIGDGRLAAYRADPSAATIAAIAETVARNLAELSGKRIGLAKVMAAMGSATAAPGKGAAVALVSTAPAPAPAKPAARTPAAPKAAPAPAAEAPAMAKGDRMTWVDPETSERFNCTVEKVMRNGVRVSWDDGAAASVVETADLRRRAGRPARAPAA